jgi:hypothetical protein
MKPVWASLVLATFAGTKVARLAGRTPAQKDIKQAPVLFWIQDILAQEPGMGAATAGPAQMSSTLNMHDCKTRVC